MSHAPQRIGRLLVDVPALCSVSYRCEPRLCRNTVTCCACYEIALTASELVTVLGLLPDAARFAPHLREPGGFMEVYDELDCGEFALAADEDGRCVFAFESTDGRTLCSLHAACLQLGIDPLVHKPRACALWPLSLSSDDPPVLAIQPGATDFPCCRPHRGPGLDRGIAEAVASLFGDEFLDQIQISPNRNGVPQAPEGRRACSRGRQPPDAGR